MVFQLMQRFRAFPVSQVVCRETCARCTVSTTARGAGVLGKLKPRFANEENSQKHRGNQEGGGKEARKPGKTPAHGIIELQKGAEWRRAPGL